MDKITCQICNAQVHSIQLHLTQSHPSCSLSMYESMYPHAPLLSEEAKKRIAARHTGAVAAAATEEVAVNAAPAVTSAVTNVVVMTPPGHFEKKAISDAFDLSKRLAGIKNARGDEIHVGVMKLGTEYDNMIPDIDTDHVWDLEFLKGILMGLEVNIPVYLWGHAGTGKTTSVIQACARTNRPTLRVQHTANTEEVHILGQYTVINGETIFEMGPLPYAMRHGLVYIADEYDFAHPSITSVYQPILEGNPLIIKEAPTADRVIKPHKNFRFVATGNTNGSGDHTGLYQGTQLGNAANYSRFGITMQALYMKPAEEKKIIVNKGRILEDDAIKIVQWANDIRKAYGSEVSVTVGQRELIYAAQIGGMRGDMKLGIQLAITNRWSPVDHEIGMSIAQRIFG